MDCNFPSEHLPNHLLHTFYYCFPVPASQVLSQRRPWCYRLLAYEDEIFALVTAILDLGSLASAGGTFSESLYSLRRAPAEGGDADGVAAPASAADGQQAASAPAPMLTRRQRQAALLLSVSAAFNLAKSPVAPHAQHVPVPRSSHAVCSCPSAA